MQLPAVLRELYVGQPPALREWLRLNGPPVLALLFMLLLVKGCVEPLRYQARDSKSKQNLHAVQLALERYSVDTPDGSYPRSIAELQRSGYLPVLPLNPFSGEPMCSVPPDRLPPPGDFVYLPQFEPGAQHASSYVLAMGSLARSVLQALSE